MVSLSEGKSSVDVLEMVLISYHYPGTQDHGSQAIPVLVRYDVVSDCADRRDIIIYHKREKPGTFCFVERKPATHQVRKGLKV